MTKFAEYFMRGIAFAMGLSIVGGFLLVMYFFAKLIGNLTEIIVK